MSRYKRGFEGEADVRRIFPIKADVYAFSWADQLCVANNTYGVNTAHSAPVHKRSR